MTLFIDFVTFGCIIVVSIKLQVWREVNISSFTRTIFIEIKEYFIRLIEKLNQYYEFADIYPRIKKKPLNCEPSSVEETDGKFGCM